MPTSTGSYLPSQVQGTPWNVNPLPSARAGTLALGRIGAIASHTMPQELRAGFLIPLDINVTPAPKCQAPSISPNSSFLADVDERNLDFLEFSLLLFLRASCLLK